jgi:phage shock protein A
MLKLKPRSPERNAIVKERKAMMARKKELQGIAKGHEPEVAELEKQLKPLKKKVKPLEKRRAKLEKQEAEINAQDPWGYAHTGNNKTDVDMTYNFKGDIEAVRPYRESGHLKSSKKEE